MRFEVLTAVNIKVIDATPCGLLGMYQTCFRDLRCLHVHVGNVLYLVAGGSMFVRNVGIYFPHYILSHLENLNA